MKPLGHPEQICEQGGCFTLSGYQKSAWPPGAGLRTRGLFCHASLSGIRCATRSRTANKGVVLLCRGIRKPLGHPEHDCEQGGCFVLPGYQKAAGPPEAAMRTRGLFCPAGQSESCWSTRSRTANKGVVLSCRGIRKPLGHPEQDCEQGGCFTLWGCHEAAGPPGAELRTRGLFCPAGVSESSWATRSSIANKGVVLSCRGIRKPLGHPEPDCEQGGCFNVTGYQEAAGAPGAGLRTRGLFCHTGRSQSYRAT